MRKTRLVLAALLVGFLFWVVPSVTQAGTIDVKAEAAQFPDGSTGCSKLAQTGTLSAYTVVRCTPGSTRKFVIPFTFPMDAPNTGWLLTASYETDGTPGPCVADWEMAVFAMPDLGTNNGGTPAAVQVTSTSRTHDVSKRHYTAESSGVDPKDTLTQVTCTSTDCRGKDAYLYIVYDSSTGTCNPADLRSVHIVY